MRTCSQTHNRAARLIRGPAFPGCTSHATALSTGMSVTPLAEPLTCLPDTRRIRAHSARRTPRTTTAAIQSGFAGEVAYADPIRDRSVALPGRTTLLRCQPRDNPTESTPPLRRAPLHIRRKSMRVVHISNTPVADAPGNIVAALNQYTDIKARHIVCNPDAYGRRAFAVDIDWRTQRDEAFSTIDAADVIHIHQPFNFTDIFGEDLSLRFGKRKVIRQFHSAPSLWAKNDREHLKRIINEPIPQLVTAQGPERFYPRARVVPNIVPIRDPRYLPQPEVEDGPPIIAYSPSGGASAWKTRWETKGAPQTRSLLRRLERAGLCRVASRRLSTRRTTCACN